MAVNVAAPLPDLTLERKSLLVIDTGDVAATITRVVIHFSQEVPELPTKIPLAPPVLVHEPINTIGGAR